MKAHTFLWEESGLSEAAALLQPYEQIMKLDTCILYKKALIRQMENVFLSIKKAHHKIEKMGILGYLQHRCPFWNSIAKYRPKHQLNGLLTDRWRQKVFFFISWLCSYWEGPFTCRSFSASEFVQSRWLYFFVVVGLVLVILGFFCFFFFFVFVI